MSKTKWLTTMAVFFGVLTGSASATGESTADESGVTPLIEDFFVVESAYAQESGETQLTLTSYYSDSDDEGGGTLATLGVEYGITDQLSVEVNLSGWFGRDPPQESLGSQSGIGDIEFGFKYAFPPAEPSDVLVAAGLEIVAPVGDVDKSLGEGYWVYEPYFILSKNIGEMTNLTFNAAYGFRSLKDTAEFEEEEEAGTDELELSLGAVRAFGPFWRGILEIAWETDKLDGGSERETNAALGVKYKGVADVELGASVDFDLTGESNNPGLFFAFSFEF